MFIYVIMSEVLQIGAIVPVRYVPDLVRRCHTS